MDYHEWWITAGEDNILRRWTIKTQTIQPKDFYKKKQKTNQRDANSALVVFEFQHPETIMDVIEINSPHLIATAWMDK